MLLCSKKGGTSPIMKKYIKTILMFGVMAALCLGYYYYISNKAPVKDSTDKAAETNTEVAALTTFNIDDNYPESPREVLKLYARITKAYYKTQISDAEIEALGKQARKLFDAELLSKQTEQEFLSALKLDIENYRNIKRYVNDFKISSASDIEYKTLNSKDYAIGVVLYYVREDNSLTSVYHSYKLRKDSNGHWKILYWETAGQAAVE